MYEFDYNRKINRASRVGSAKDAQSSLPSRNTNNMRRELLPARREFTAATEAFKNGIFRDDEISVRLRHNVVNTYKKLAYTNQLMPLSDLSDIAYRISLRDVDKETFKKNFESAVTNPDYITIFAQTIKSISVNSNGYYLANNTKLLRDSINKLYAISTKELETETKRIEKDTGREPEEIREFENGYIPMKYLLSQTEKERDDYVALRKSWLDEDEVRYDHGEFDDDSIDLSI